MAILANIVDLEVGRRLAGGAAAIVATETGASNAVVAEIRYSPACGHVAVFAGVRGWNMAAGFAHCPRAIVAISATTNNSRVIKNSDCPVQ